MNPIKVEQNAVDKVRACFDDCDRIIAGVQTNDKTIAWDGHLYLYKDSSCKKNSYYALIPVQVKGVSCLEKHPDSINYSIDIVDLKAYKDDGIAYFVVYINKRKKTVYYVLLAPIEIKAIISICSEQNSKSVSLQKLDCSNPDKLDSLFREFYDDCKRQKSFVDLPSLSFESLKELGNPELTVFGYSNESEPLPRLLAKNDFFIYANVGKGPAKSLYPVGTGKCSIIVSGVYNNPVTVGGIVFFNRYSIINNRDCDVVALGNCLTMTLPHEDSSIINVKVDFDGTKNTLLESIHELEFLLALEHDRHLNIAGCDFDMTKVDNQGATVITGLRDLRTPYERLVKLKKALDVLHVKEDLDLRLLKKKDERLIDILIQAFVEKKEVVENKPVGMFVEIPICNICVFVFAIKTGDNTYRLEDVFNPPFQLQGSLGDGVYPITPYSVLNKERILKYSNIGFEQMLPSFKANLSENPNCLQLASSLGLSLLSAYDEQKVKQERLIHTALELFEWMLEEETDEQLKLKHKLNLLQVKKRLSLLSDDDKEALYNAIESSSSDEIKFAAYLLLDDNAFAMRSFNRLDAEVQDFYRTLPIFHFVK
jgi:hypothetical protein